jgi:hypothetical protein
MRRERKETTSAALFDDTGKRYGQNFRFRIEGEEKLNQRPVLYDPSSSKNSPHCGPDFPGRQDWAHIIFATLGVALKAA